MVKYHFEFIDLCVNKDAIFRNNGLLLLNNFCKSLILVAFHFCSLVFTTRCSYSDPSSDHGIQNMTARAPDY